VAEAPEVMSLEGESEATRKLYGIGELKTDDFGRARAYSRPNETCGV
jgi:hypothetical protein